MQTHFLNLSAPNNKALFVNSKNDTKRKTLSLPKEGGTTETVSEVEVGYIELALPCRTYQIDYQVSVASRLAPDLEFLLRLVFLAPGIERLQAQEYFGYNDREISFSVEKGVRPGYLSERDGRLELTDSGRELFSTIGGEPRLFSVRKKTGKVRFDLISVSPANFKRSDIRNLPELPLLEGLAAKEVPERVRRHFSELDLARDKSDDEFTTLYSIDRVQPENRFLEDLPVSIKAKSDKPSEAYADLSEWRPDHEITDRLKIEHEVSKFVESMKSLSRKDEANEAYDILLQLFPEYLDKYSTRNGLNVDRFWRHISKIDASPRRDRQTLPVIGSLFAPNNSVRFDKVLDYSLKTDSKPTDYIWIAPQAKTWAASSSARKTNSLIRTKIEASTTQESDFSGISNLCVFYGSSPYHLKDVFDDILEVDRPYAPKELEFLLIPGLLVFASVHAPIFLQNGFPTPVGILSFDKAAIDRANSFLSERFGSIAETVSPSLRKSLGWDQNIRDD